MGYFHILFFLTFLQINNISYLLPAQKKSTAETNSGNLRKEVYSSTNTVGSVYAHGHFSTILIFYA